MHDQAKNRIVAAVDRLAARGILADRVTLHPDTARDLAVHGTHIDLGSDRLFHSAEQIQAELMDPEHDPRGAHDPHPGAKPDGEGKTHRPKSPDEAAALAKPRCHKSLRRPNVTLAVVLDAALKLDELRVTGQKVQPEMEVA